VRSSETFLKGMCAYHSIYLTRGLSLSLTLNPEEQIEGSYFEPFWLSIVPTCYSLFFGIWGDFHETWKAADKKAVNIFNFLFNHTILNDK